MTTKMMTIRTMPPMPPPTGIGMPPPPEAAHPEPAKAAAALTAAVLDLGRA